MLVAFACDSLTSSAFICLTDPGFSADSSTVERNDDADARNICLAFLCNRVFYAVHA